MSQYIAEFLLNSIFNKLCVLITILLGHAFCQDKIVSQTVKKGQKGRMLKKLLGYTLRRSLVQALKQHQIKQTNDWHNPIF